MHITSYIQTGSRTVTCLLGLLVIAIAGTAASLGFHFNKTVNLIFMTFGPAFIFLFITLVFVSLYCWQKQNELWHDKTARHPWTEAAMQCADGISTLALTFTLLGISLGIGTLADKVLTPDTVQIIVKDLTKHFSLAFLTTVVGLPTSAMLRSMVRVTEAKCVARAPRALLTNEREKK
ncbi:MAG: hypothetical protein CMM58_02140 [Rhodospirillaceae bacterium]|nr:hypothetical protein [Rhodospirillaceae bacterium]|tara:strand:- start:552 stop:1085 length:534 start_codon:yes stop_codon:yes gene_type:complete